MVAVNEDAASNESNEEQGGHCDERYRCLVVDSGPIIRMTGLTALRDKAQLYYTVPAVLQEIRDAKARQHMGSLPFELITREASPEGVQAMVNFSRQTGDYQSLSSVDLQVLGLLYDLEREGCSGDMSHIRKTPKRTVGVGKIEALNGKTPEEASVLEEINDEEEPEEVGMEQIDSGAAFFQRTPIVPEEPAITHEAPAKPKTWAMLVNPTLACAQSPKLADRAITQIDFGKVNLGGCGEVESLEGQFSDADEDDASHASPCEQGEESSNDEYEYDEHAEISDEECDVYILDPQEVEERRRSQQYVEEGDELKSDFPSLLASMQVPYDGSDHEESEKPVTAAILARRLADKRKLQALKPVSKSGKLYDSFQKYSEIMKPKEVKPVDGHAYVEETKPESTGERKNQGNEQSRIIGGADLAGQGTQVDDDGEGWVTSTNDIRHMKAAGKLNPTQTPPGNGKETIASVGPPNSKRTACTTTDFAMQNVILQMNFELLTVDGIKVRRLKTWVSRCGACFTIYTDTENSGPYKPKRLFCSRCGSDMMQRVAASVDSKTGRLRLHLSKNYKTSTRGTKFSLPKPGSNNRFQGDLLLREDQLMMGAWNQKVKKMSGGSSKGAAQSVFGSDLAANVGCHATRVHSDDIKVGFGRRNPNAATGGRERRGKKKKTGDKACGLRRY